MKKIINSFKLDKKILNFINKCSHIGIILCLFSFLFTYYYFISFQKNILFMSIYLFEFGSSIFFGSLISGIIINEKTQA